MGRHGTPRAVLTPAMYTERRVQTWQGLVACQEEFLRPRDGGPIQWMFRGESSTGTILASSLERAVLDVGTPARFRHDRTDPQGFAARRALLRTGLDGCPIPRLERALVREFQRLAHHYVADVPADGNVMEWLSLMRHYGAPCRLHDWTYSFWVAVFFAVNRARPSDDSVVWALDADWADGAAERAMAATGRLALRRDRNVQTASTFRSAFDSRPRRAFALPMAPHRLNERHTIQQSIFLVPGDVARPFEDNLAAMLARAPRGRLIRVIIGRDADFRRGLLRRLYRMNVTSTVLFPDLTGFAESLWLRPLWADIVKRQRPRPW